MRSARILVALVISLAAASSLAQTNVSGIDFAANNTLAVSGASHLRLRYNTGTGALEASINGAAYTTVQTSPQTLTSTYAAGASSTDSIMLLDSTRGPVVVRDSSPSSGSTLLAVQNNAAATFLSITPSGQQFIRSGAADGAATVGLAVDSFNGFANATSKIFRVLTGGSERFFITGPGNVNLLAATAISGSGVFDLSGSSGTFDTTTGTNTLRGNVSLTSGKTFVYAGGASTFDASAASGIFSTSTGTNTLSGNVSLVSGKTFVYAGGASTFDGSAASGVFKTTTGAHTFGSASWAVPANLAVTGGSSLTNTTGMLLTPNVAAGASSVVFKVNNSVALTTGSLMQIGDNAVARFQVKPLNTDGFQLIDSVGTTAFINVSTNVGTNINYGAAFVGAASGSASVSDGTNTWALSGGLMTGQQLKMLPVSSAQTAETESWRDSAGASRYGVDISGLPSLGSRFEHRINFMCATTAAAGAVNLVASQTNVTPAGCVPDWAYTSTANATGFVNTSGLGTNSALSGGITIGDGTTNTNSTTAQSSPIAQLNNLTNLAFVYEQTVTMSATGGNNATFRVGMANGLVSAAHPGGWYFQKATTDTNWQCVTDDGTTTSSGDTTAAASTSAQVLRIEYYGSGTPLANGTKTVKFYVDGVLGANCTRTTNVYSAGAVAWSAQALSTTTSAQKTLSLGPALLVFNELASPFAP